MLEIDGSFGEGGGQILRTALSLSTILKIPFRLFNIRKKRPEPGLKTQHLLAIQAISQITDSKVEGNYLGSEEIKFWPGKIYAKDLNLKIETAASITLILQTLIPPALFAPAPLKINFDGGGTDVPFSPTIDYFRFCFLKILEKMGAKVEVNVIKRGYYPTGGGKVKVEIFPSKLKPLNLIEKGKLEKIFIISHASQSLKEKMVAERQARSAQEVFQKLKLKVEKIIAYQQTDCPGSSLLVAADFENTILGIDGLGRLEKKSEQIGLECALTLLKEEREGACLDKFLIDQILIYLSLTGKKCQIRVGELSLHAKTNLWLISQFLGENFQIKDKLLSWNPL